MHLVSSDDDRLDMAEKIFGGDEWVNTDSGPKIENLSDEGKQIVATSCVK